MIESTQMMKREYDAIHDGFAILAAAKRAVRRVLEADKAAAKNSGAAKKRKAVKRSVKPVAKKRPAATKRGQK